MFPSANSEVDSLLGTSFRHTCHTHLFALGCFRSLTESLWSLWSNIPVFQCVVSAKPKHTKTEHIRRGELPEVHLSTTRHHTCFCFPTCVLKTSCLVGLWCHHIVSYVSQIISNTYTARYNLKQSCTHVYLIVCVCIYIYYNRYIYIYTQCIYNT